MRLKLLSSQYPGMRQWLIQRLSASSMAFYLLLLVLRWCWLQPHDYAAWRGFFSPIWWRLLTLWFFVCLLLHAWLGVRNVLRDYIPNLRWRAALEMLVNVAVLVDLLAVLWISVGMTI